MVRIPKHRKRVELGIATEFFDEADGIEGGQAEV